VVHLTKLAAVACQVLLLAERASLIFCATTGQARTLAPVDMPLNMGVSSLAVFPLTHVSTVNPRDLLTTFSPCIRSISYFLLFSMAVKQRTNGCGSSTGQAQRR
jgi:hypothetical protein